jgi:hypothetical protein
VRSDEPFVQTLLGNGDGTFQSPIETLTNDKAVSAVVQDFNGDGILDLAVLAGCTVSTLLGNGDGTFQPPLSEFLAWSSDRGIATGDFNRDGKWDVAVVAALRVGVFLGNGDGTIRPGAEFDLSPTSTSVVAADFKGDLRPDLAILSVNSVTKQSMVSVMLNVP